MFQQISKIHFALSKSLIVFFLLILVTHSLLNGKVPFSTLYLEIVKDRYDGEMKYLKNKKKYKGKISKNTSIQTIWVDVNSKSYLMIEEPSEGNELTEKIGRLKYKDKHYTLDFDMHIAWDETETNKIFDNYTSEEADYQYYSESKYARKLVKTKEGIKRKAHRYNYKIFDNTDFKATEAYKKEIMSSDMPNEDKELEIAILDKALDDKATQIIEWIWVEDGVEMGMFIKKREYGANVLTEYNVIKLVPNDEFDIGIFESTLEDFKIKVIKNKE